MKTLSKIAFLVLLLAATSCASRKKTVTPTKPQAFEWMTSKLSIHAESDSLAFDDLSGQLRMRKDRLIWISVSGAMGVEALRVKISSDSVWMVNRLEKTYLAEPLDSIASQLNIPLSFPLIQTLLLDNNEGLSPVENQTIQLKNFVMGNFSAKIKIHHIRLDEKTTFPLKITDKMERIKIKTRYED